MDRLKTRLLYRFAWVAISTLAVGGCAASASARREDVAGDRGTAVKPPDESAYRDAAMKFLKYLRDQRQSGEGVLQASGTNGIYPMYECMEYGCPDRVFCKKAGAYCHVTFCSKGGCRVCPDWAPDVFKSLLVKEWCKFDCLKGSARAGTAFGYVSVIGKSFFVGPFCLDE